MKKITILLFGLLILQPLNLLAYEDCSDSFTDSKKAFQTLSREGRITEELVEEFGSRELGKAIIKRITERKKFPLNEIDRSRAKKLFDEIKKTPIILRTCKAKK